MAVYFFFFFSLIGEQFLDPSQGYPDHNVDLYIPFFAFLQLFFYVSWLKVAEALLNPFGSDDHDFEFVPMLTRHMEVSVVVVVSEPRPNIIWHHILGVKSQKCSDLWSFLPKIDILYCFILCTQPKAGQVLKTEAEDRCC